jgi:hypothetical protein
MGTVAAFHAAVLFYDRFLPPTTARLYINTV